MSQIFLPIFMVLASVGLYFGWIDPTYKGAGDLKTKNQELDSAINNANQLTEIRQQLLEKLNSFPESDTERLSKLLPDHIDNVRLIMEVDRIALKYGMSLRGVKVEELDKDEKAAVASAGPALAIGGVGGRYQSATLKFSVSSSYESFKKFMKEIEDNLRLSDVEKIVFSAIDSQKGAEVYKFDISLKTHWLKL